MRRERWLRAGGGLPGRGMVLIAVLWTVAALSLIVTGMVHSLRSELRQISSSRQVVEGSALGGGAIAQVLQSMSMQALTPASAINATVSFQGRDIEVRAAALSGWIDLNMAPSSLLEKLFVVAGELPPQQAATVAQAVKDERSRLDRAGRPVRFEAVEDLLKVPGVDYELYAKVADLLTTDSGGSGKVNVLAAPPAVLNVLADGKAGVAERIAGVRAASPTGLDTTALDSSLVDNAPSQRYLIQARVPLADGAWLLATRWVELSDGRQDGLPWRIFHADNRLDVPPR